MIKDYWKKYIEKRKYISAVEAMSSLQYAYNQCMFETEQLLISRNTGLYDQIFNSAYKTISTEFNLDWLTEAIEMLTKEPVIKLTQNEKLLYTWKLP